MIATLVTFRDTTRRWTREALIEAFEGSTPAYRGMDGLLSKVYLIDQEMGEFGGFYLWASREQMAAAQGSDTWLAAVRARYGITPALRVFEAPLTIDNASALAATAN
jgi:hypothetical protein